MSKVFFSITMSLDGYIAPEWRSDEQWIAQWSELQAYVLAQRFFRENLGLGAGGETGVDNEILAATFERTGATILGKRMFDAGENQWPEEAPFHTPVFVLTRKVREPWPRLGGTTFHFVNDGIESALQQARQAAGDRDVRIGGGAQTIQQFLNAGMIDEFQLTVSPVLLHAGIRLFERIDMDRLQLTQIGAVASPRVTHLRYRVETVAC